MLKIKDIKELEAAGARFLKLATEAHSKSKDSLDANCTEPAYEKIAKKAFIKFREGLIAVNKLLGSPEYLLPDDDSENAQWSLTQRKTWLLREQYKFFINIIKSLQLANQPSYAKIYLLSLVAIMLETRPVGLEGVDVYSQTEINSIIRLIKEVYDSYKINFLQVYEMIYSLYRCITLGEQKECEREFNELRALKQTKSYDDPDDDANQRKSYKFDSTLRPMLKKDMCELLFDIKLKINQNFSVLKKTQLPLINKIINIVKSYGDKIKKIGYFILGLTALLSAVAVPVLIYNGFIVGSVVWALFAVILAVAGVKFCFQGWQDLKKPIIIPMAAPIALELTLETIIAEAEKNYCDGKYLDVLKAMTKKDSQGNPLFFNDDEIPKSFGEVCGLFLSSTEFSDFTKKYNLLSNLQPKGFYPDAIIYLMYIMFESSLKVKLEWKDRPAKLRDLYDSGSGNFLSKYIHCIYKDIIEDLTKEAERLDKIASSKQQNITRIRRWANETWHRFWYATPEEQFSANSENFYQSRLKEMEILLQMSFLKANFLEFFFPFDPTKKSMLKDKSKGLREAIKKIKTMVESVEKFTLIENGQAVVQQELIWLDEYLLVLGAYRYLEAEESVPEIPPELNLDLSKEQEVENNVTVTQQQPALTALRDSKKAAVTSSSHTQSNPEEVRRAALK